MPKPKSKNTQWHGANITKEERQQLLDSKGAVVWFTGLSGSGKSTIARCVEHLVLERHIPTYVLDGDNIRFGLNKDLGFSPADRTENIRRIGEVAKLFADGSIVTLTAFISPYPPDRAPAPAPVPRRGWRACHQSLRPRAARRLRAARAEGPRQQAPRRPDPRVHGHQRSLRGA